MASVQGNAQLLGTQYFSAVNAQPLQQNRPSGQNAGWLQKFMKGEPKSLGVVQIMIGIIHIGLGGVLASTSFVPIPVVFGVVFWAPIFFFISGGLSVSAEKNGNRCQVKGALGMNIVSAVVAVIAFIIYVIDLWAPIYYNAECNSYNDCLHAYSTRAFRMGIMAVLSILSLLEFCISISTSAFGCKSVCGDSSSQAGQPLFVVQNACPMQTTAGITITEGMPLMGQVMNMAPRAPMVQCMPTSYIRTMMPVNPLAPGVQSAPFPTTEAPPSYNKNVPGCAAAPGVQSAPFPTTEASPSYNKNVPGCAPAAGVQSAPFPTTEATPSYNKNVPGCAPAAGVQSAPFPTTEATPSYNKNVPGCAAAPGVQSAPFPTTEASPSYNKNVSGCAP